GEDNNFHNISQAKDFNDLESNEDDSDNEVIKNIILENPRFMGGKMKPNENKGASTPSNEVLKVLVFTYVDFNADLNLEDHSTGSSNIREFKDCVEEIEVLDINRLVLNFNWNKKPKGANGFLKKIDRIMANLDFLDSYVDLFNDVLHEEEATCVLAFNDALIMEERFLKQKAKVDQVPMAFVNHYATFLGQPGVTLNLNSHNIFTKKLDYNVALDMIKTMTPKEVKEAMFLMGDDKSPGPDDYTVAFFEEAWDVMANDVTKVVQEFFTSGTILKELNHTIMALILKIMDCVYSTSLSLSINGVLHGYFKGQRGLRQDSDSFTYHRYCEELDIINLCFADDLFLFAHGDTNSARVLMEALDEFKLVSRITPNLPKSTA
nr:hypothetical protein [Tanacetum cinerariifolium]